MKSSTGLVLAAGGLAAVMLMRKPQPSAQEQLDTVFGPGGAFGPPLEGVHLVELPSPGGFGLAEMVRRRNQPFHRSRNAMHARRAPADRRPRGLRTRRVWHRNSAATGLHGLGAVSQTVVGAVYKVRMRASAVPADAPKTQLFSSAYWQERLRAAGQQNVRVDSVKYVATENQSGWWTDPPTADYLFDVTATVTAPGGNTGIGDSFFDNVFTRGIANVFASIGRALSGGFDVVIEKVTKVRDLVVETAQKGIETGKQAIDAAIDAALKVPKGIGENAMKVLLVGGVVVGGLIFMAGKSKAKTRYATFGG